MKPLLFTKYPYRVFVYGTLMTGYRNNKILHDGAMYTGMAKTQEKYYMLHLGNFPGVISTDNNVVVSETHKDKFRVDDDSVQNKASHIFGETFAVDKLTLERMDALEGHPNFFKREKVTVRLDAFLETTEAWMYFFQTDRFFNKGKSSFVGSGNWKRAQ